MKDFRLTFNKPAMERMGGENAKHLKIKIDDHGMVHFSPVSTQGRDTVEIGGRTRGGGEAMVEGQFAEQLLKALTNRHGPFFTLQQEKGSFTAIPYQSPSAPSKFQPHVRVWVPKANAAPANAVGSHVVSLIDNLREAKDTIRNARLVLERHNSDRRVGRPSREVLEAKAILTEFASLVETISGIDLKLINDTNEALAKLDVPMLQRAQQGLGEIVRSFNNKTDTDAVIDATVIVGSDLGRRSKSWGRNKTTRMGGVRRSPRSHGSAVAH